MKIAVGVLTYNRFHFLVQTLASMDAAPGYPFARVLVDGCSSDEVQRAFVMGQGGYVFGEVGTVGRGMNKAIELALATGPDIVVFTADDYDFKPDWCRRLVTFWQEAPADIAIATLNWEPMYPWNIVHEQMVIGGEHVLIRGTAPGSSWSFRASDWPIIGPIEDKTGGEDLTVCTRMKAMGRKLAALDLTLHTGERESVWGNQSWQRAQPLKFH